MARLCRGETLSQALRIVHGAFGRVALLDMDRSLVRHAHPHCHVLLKIGGDDTQFAVGSHVAPLTGELAVLVNAWEPHAYVHDPLHRNALILALYVEPAWLRGFRPDWGASGAPGFFEYPTGRVDAMIRRLAQDLVDAMVDPAGAPAVREGLLSELMIRVIARFATWRGKPGLLIAAARRPGIDYRVRRAIRAMRADPAAAVRMARVAREVGLSRAHFFRLFEHSTGVTPHVFLNMLRIERAVDDVAGSEDGLAAIGHRLGFVSPAHFSRFFRDHVSVAPREFRMVLRAA